MLYGQPFPMSDAAMKDDFLIPLDSPKVELAGTDVTIVTYSRGCQVALDAAEKLQKEGVSAEV